MNRNMKKKILLCLVLLLLFCLVIISATTIQIIQKENARILQTACGPIDPHHLHTKSLGLLLALEVYDTGRTKPDFPIPPDIEIPEIKNQTIYVISKDVKWPYSWVSSSLVMTLTLKYTPGLSVEERIATFRAIRREAVVQLEKLQKEFLIRSIYGFLFERMTGHDSHRGDVLASRYATENVLHQYYDGFSITLSEFIAHDCQVILYPEATPGEFELQISYED